MQALRDIEQPRRVEENRQWNQRIGVHVGSSRGPEQAQTMPKPRPRLGLALVAATFAFVGTTPSQEVKSILAREGDWMRKALEQ
jgi:hypothetical protein